MNHENVLERLDDWVGGELPGSERAEMDLHLAGCAECRAEADALRALLEDVAALPPAILPARDLWTDIAARLEPRDSVAADATTGVRRSWRAPRWAMQAAAAVALIVGSSGITYVTMGRKAVVKVASDLTQPITRKPAQSALVAFQPAEQDYQAAIGELQSALQSQRGRLAPETVQTLEANLRIIDEAIRQSRDALARDPNSAEVARMLAEAYDQKLNVLQQAVQL
jgi:anti-sigma-K factor RskA